MKNLFLVLALTATISLQAQKSGQYDISKLLSNKKVTVINRTATVLLEGDHQGVHMDERSGQGVLWLNDVTFGDGVIEVDIRGRDMLQKSFVGVAFHGLNDSTYDVVYFRPFNFRSPDPVRKIHAVQYVSEPEFDWKKLRDEHNGVYEKAVTPAPDPRGWFHARIEVRGETVNVFVNGSTVASLTVSKLNQRASGKIGLWVGETSDGDFSNLTISGTM